ncbi:MAG: hypothetical protein NTW29_04930 [Bacteroidetes bacterium]|nr:hypothetical protein [Bacteroidota bacterium]
MFICTSCLKKYDQHTWACSCGELLIANAVDTGDNSPEAMLNRLYIELSRQSAVCDDLCRQIKKLSRLLDDSITPPGRSITYDEVVNNLYNKIKQQEEEARIYKDEIVNQEAINEKYKTGLALLEEKMIDATGKIKRLKISGIVKTCIILAMVITVIVMAFLKMITLQFQAM